MIDKSPFPSQDGSSIDSSRIIRADYKDLSYAALCVEAQSQWRNGTGIWEGLGDEGRYSECGLVLVADASGAQVEGMGGTEYVHRSMENVRALLAETGVEDVEDQVVELLDRKEIVEVCRTRGGGTGDSGYVNWTSGWADAEEAMRFVRARCEEQRDIDFLTGEVVGIVERKVGAKHRGGEEESVVDGVELSDGRVLRAGLTVLATGAWTPGLLDLEGRANSTGQVVAYVDVTEEEEERYEDMPVMLNLSTGMSLYTPRDRKSNLRTCTCRPLRLPPFQRRPQNSAPLPRLRQQGPHPPPH